VRQIIGSVALNSLPVFATIPAEKALATFHWFHCLRASPICWTATVCGAPVAMRPDPVEVGFFIHGEPLRLVFDTAAVQWLVGGSDRRPGRDCA
jgi:hypothetical protein